MNPVATKPASKHAVKASAVASRHAWASPRSRFAQVVVLARDPDQRGGSLGRPDRGRRRSVGSSPRPPQHLEAGLAHRASDGSAPRPTGPSGGRSVPRGSARRSSPRRSWAGTDPPTAPSLVRLKWALRESSGSYVHRTQRDALVQALGALRELQGIPHPAVPAIGQRGQHVRVGVQPFVGIDAGPPEHVADQLVAVERSPRRVPAVARALGSSRAGAVDVRPRWRSSRRKIAVGVAEARQRPELHARARARPRCAWLPAVHRASLPSVPRTTESPCIARALGCAAVSFGRASRPRGAGAPATRHRPRRCRGGV